MSEQKKETSYKTQLTKVNETYLPMITNQLENNNITLSEYSKSCVANAISAINNVLDTNGITWGDTSLDTNGITQILLSVATLQLNATANPRECYFQLRNVAVKNGKETVWKKKIEMGIEGDGFDALVFRFGRDVKKVYPHWLVREDDDFKYPRYAGVSITPPEWQPKGTGKVVRVVYPIQSTDGSVEYYISERADVKKNLIAHISNNMMNETFGVCADRYKATDDQKVQIAEKKREVLDKAKELDLDALLDSAEFDKFISPAWKEHSENMIVRKMRNNITKKIPKDFSSSLQAELFNETTDEAYRMHKAELLEVANNDLEDAVIVDVDETTEETTEPAAKPEF